MANRLKSATSPYLLQHADNPVDWWPWSDEAFAEARRRDVPVLLSVGYAACHWCHVMAHESFEDPATAAEINNSVVAIKVDREERPDVDAVYMTATTAMNRGQGGWPMTVFMTPDGEPFFAGTYFPRAQFTHLVRTLSQLWKEKKEEIKTESERNAAALRRYAASLGAAGAAAGEPQLEGVTAAALAGLEAGFDRVNGGFGGAPKFPPSMALEFLLRHHERTGSRPALEIATSTCEAMARGGMYDQLGGGFARYSVDATWTVPHFEKMLYDNALLAGVYTHLWRLTGSALARRVAEETCDFLLRELRTAQGGFASSLDADSASADGHGADGHGADGHGADGHGAEGHGADGHGAEGAFYVWTPAELSSVLGEADAAFAAQVFGVTRAGTFEHGASVLQRRAEPGGGPRPHDEPHAYPSDGSDISPGERFNRIRGLLFAARSGRPVPGRDDKVVAAWNGLAIGVLAEAGTLLPRPEFVEAASAAAELLDTVHGHYRRGRIMRTSRDGVAGPSAGLLEDYACVASGLLRLAGVTGEDRWVTAAGKLLDVVLAEFGDGRGGFFDTAEDGERLIFRPNDPTDGATPSGTFAAADALLSYGALTGEARYREAAVAALGALAAIAAREPRFGGMGLAVAEALLSGPAEIAIVGPADDPRTCDLLRTALHTAPPGAVFALGPGSAAAGSGSRSPGSDGAVVPLLADRPLVLGGPAAYVCRGFTCQAPVTTPAALRETLRRAS